MGISSPNSAIDGIVMITDATYSTRSAAIWLWVMRMPIGTPVRMAIATDTLTIEMCSSVLWPITGRFATMKLIVSTGSPSRRCPPAQSSSAAPVATPELRHPLHQFRPYPGMADFTRDAAGSGRPLTSEGLTPNTRR